MATRSKAITPQTELPATFEQALEELQSIVNAMEQQDLPLDKAIESYQRGVELSKLCSEKLSAAEQQVQVLQNGQFKALTNIAQEPAPSPNEGNIT